MNKITITCAPPACINRQHRALIRRAVTAALKHLRQTAKLSLAFTLCDNAFIQGVNREARAKDAPTDVLSFPNLEVQKGQSVEAFAAAFDIEDGFIYLGDVLLSLEQAAAQAQAYGHTVEREIAFLTVHAVLHLVGYDHERGKADETEMFSLQDEIMKKLALER